MISLLSPAKNMDFSSNGNGMQTSMPSFLDDSDYLMGKLKKKSARQLGKMMSINAELSDLNFERNQKWNKEFQDNDQRIALQAFSGEVYRGLNASDFSGDDLDFANDHIGILSGLYGLLRAKDLIQPYRLEMGTSWKITPKVTNLYKYWGGRISEKLDEILEGHSEKVIVNLASNEYWKAVDRKKLKARVITCNFLDLKNGEYKAVMTWAKQARGMMAREIVKNRVDEAEQLKTLTFGNYYFNPDMSDENTLSFTRDKAVML